MPPFLEAVAEKSDQGLHLCVGLDPDLEQIPEGVDVVEFLLEIVQSTAEYACCFKPNIAFFEDRGPVGVEELRFLITDIKARFDNPIILDAKRADIGNTNRGYARMVFEVMHADAVTSNPYFGEESLRSFFDYENSFVIVMCLTSNPGSLEFQKQLIELHEGITVRGQSKALLYELVAHNVANEWEFGQRCGLVVGTTHPEQAQIVREIAPNTFILLPGVGRQGGDLEKAVRAVSSGPFVINASSAVLYASKDPKNFGQAAAEVARNYSEQIKAVLGT